jgi:UDP-N-acetylglucosamine transferase subunit ALG13
VIFATVGTHDEGFPRLVGAVDELALGIDDEVVIQTGHTDLRPDNARSFSFLPDESEFNDHYRSADAVVGHAGAGTILTAVQHRTPIVVVPRREEYGEHIDDQQTELADALENRTGIAVVYDTDELRDAVVRLRDADDVPTLGRGDLSSFLTEYVEVLDT